MTYVPMWKYRADEITAIARQVKAAAPEVWRGQLSEPSTPEFPKYVAAACNARLGDREVDIPGYGRVLLRAADVGANGKRGTAVLSRDVIACANPTGCGDTSGTYAGLEVIDIVASTGTSIAGITFQDVTVNPETGDFYTPSRWIRSDAPVVGEPGGQISHNCKLGLSWFWILRGWRDHREQVTRIEAFINAHLKPDFYRGLVSVGGVRFPGIAFEGLYDPWEHAGAWWTWPDHGALLQQVTDHVFDDGKKMMWTLTGGIAQMRSSSERRELCQHFVRQMHGRWEKIELVECVNEYEVNGFDSAMLHEMARELRRAGMPESVPLALSSPNLIMGGHATKEAIHEEVRALSCPEATAFTTHWNRGNFVAPDLGRYADGKRLYSSEPRGPRASAGGDVSDPATLARDYQAAIDGGYVGYVLHSNWGVYDRLLHAAFVTPGGKGEHADLADIPGISEIITALVAVRSGLVPEPGHVQPSFDYHLAVGEQLFPMQTLRSPHGRYTLIYQDDGNLVLYAKDEDRAVGSRAIWASGTAGTRSGVLSMQHDGNLVLYDGDHQPVWATDTGGLEGATAQLQDDGNFVLYHKGSPVWASADN